MIAIIGAVGRLTDAGIRVDDAADTVLRILHETESEDAPDCALDHAAIAEGCPSGRPIAHGLLPTKSVRTPARCALKFL
jgi:hypothetical protein